MGILHKQAQSIIDLLARAIGIAEGYSEKDTLTRLSANVNFKPIKQEVDHNLEEQWKCGIQNVVIFAVRIQRHVYLRLIFHIE